jgi:hypothetical protein
VLKTSARGMHSLLGDRQPSYKNKKPPEARAALRSSLAANYPATSSSVF